jgi:hypothetical protein
MTDMFRFGLKLQGHRTALSRIGSVKYQLRGYPQRHDRQIGGPRERLFELKELADRFSIAQANVRLRSQPDGHPSILPLSRFINMSESGPRLDDDFIEGYPDGQELIGDGLTPPPEGGFRDSITRFWTVCCWPAVQK